MFCIHQRISSFSMRAGYRNRGTFQEVRITTVPEIVFMTTNDQHLSDAAVIMRLVTSSPDASDEKCAREAAHLANCTSCSARIGELRRFTDLLREPRMDSLQRLTGVIEQVEEERAAADTVLPSIFKNPRESWRAKLLASGAVNTVGMVDALVAHAETTFASAPPSALQSSALAVEIGDAIRIDSYPFDLVISTRARAWREHAFLLSYVGRFPDALQAVDRAEQLFRQIPADYDLARTSVIRAMIYRSIDRLGEAVALTRDAADTFDSCGDHLRYIRTRMTEASILVQQGAISEALAIWQPLEDAPELRADRAYGNLLQNIGNCYRELKQPDLARTYLERSIVEYDKHNLTVEKVRSQWTLASNFTASGNFDDALPLLRQTWEEFERQLMEADAALVGLEVAELLLILGQPDEVPLICRRLLDRFTRNSMTSRAVTALAYLREAAAMGKATPALVRHVHDFIRDIPRHPMRPYAPPQL
jgi:tetratricopeptide (TPR) repeat protein